MSKPRFGHTQLLCVSENLVAACPSQSQSRILVLRKRHHRYGLYRKRCTRQTSVFRKGRRGQPNGVRYSRLVPPRASPSAFGAFAMRSTPRASAYVLTSPVGS
jgi:hypothetical protein